MNLHTLARDLANYAQYYPYSSLSTLKGHAAIKRKEDDYEVLALTNKNNQIIPVLHATKNKQLLVWCSLLELPIDLSKIRPIKRKQLACHKVMLEQSALINKDKSWPDFSEELLKIGTGDFDSKWSPNLAELVQNIGAAHLIQKTIFKELINNYPGAVLEKL